LNDPGDVRNLIKSWLRDVARLANFYPLPGAPRSKAMHLKESLQWFCL